MDEFPVFDVYSDMTLRMTGLEKNQVPKCQGFLGDRFSGLGKLFGGARCLFIEYVTKGYMHKPGAIDARLAEAAQFVRRVFPG